MKAQRFYDSIAETYDRRFQGKVALIENELATANLPTRNVLDLGCGTGLYLEYCQPEGYIGVDLSVGMLAVARAKFTDAKFIQSDMSAIPLPDNSVDAVVSLFGSFSYCLTPHRCVDGIRRVLCPNGRVVAMAFGQRYISRKSHIAPHLNFWTYTARQLKYLFAPSAAPIGNVKVRGLNMAIDALEWLPMPLLRGVSIGGVLFSDRGGVAVYLQRLTNREFIEGTPANTVLLILTDKSHLLRLFAYKFGFPFILVAPKGAGI